MGFPGSSDSKEFTCNVGDLSSLSGLGKSPGGGHDNPLQYSCLRNPHGQRSLAGYSPLSHKQLDMTERLSIAHILFLSTSNILFYFLLEYNCLYNVVLVGAVHGCSVAKSCPTLCDPMECSPPGSSVRGDSPGKNTVVGCHALL